MTTSAIVAAIWTLPLVWYGGSEEPFVGNFDVVDWLIMFVGSGLGVLFWFAWSCAIVYAVARRWWPMPMVLLLTVAISIGYLQRYKLDSLAGSA